MPQARAQAIRFFWNLESGILNAAGAGARLNHTI